MEDRKNNPEKYNKQRTKYNINKLQKKRDNGKVVLQDMKKDCCVCGERYIPNTSYQKICGDKNCKKEMWRRNKSQWASKNRENLREYDKQFYEKNSESYLKKQRKRYQKYKETKNNYYISLILRSRVYVALNNKGIKKTKSTEELIGCDIEFLKKYIEEQFEEGMSWENHGWKTWHIDHIKPCAAFDDLNDEEQQKECFHYSNMQPMWAKDNLKKGARYEAD